VSLSSTLEAAALFHVFRLLLLSGDFTEGVHIHGHAIVARWWARQWFELLEDAPPSERPGVIRRGEASLLAEDVEHNPLVEPLPSSSATVGRTCYYTCVHLAILRICDTRALDAVDWGALTARYGLLFKGSIAFCLYDTRRVHALFVQYALCYDLCTRRTVRDDIM
jgi:hypothetical protein